MDPLVDIQHTAIIAMTGPMKAHTVPSSIESQQLQGKWSLGGYIQKVAFINLNNQMSLYLHLSVTIAVWVHSRCDGDRYDGETCE